MKSKIFLFIGIIFIGVGIIITQSKAGVTINKQQVSAEEGQKFKNYFGFGLSGFGAIFAIIGIAGIIQSANQKKRNLYILQHGIDAEGVITFVDKNWTILVNHKPIYSVVEYTYKDKQGIQHTRKINNLSSEIVIRKNYHVGMVVPIKYLAEKPDESVLILSN